MWRCSQVDYFELPASWVVILELVQGGEVFDRIVELGAYSENDAATFIHQVGLALQVRRMPGSDETDRHTATHSRADVSCARLLGCP